MKSYLKETINKGSESNTFSVYNNPDKELRAEIASFTIDQSTVDMGWPKKTWEIIEEDGDEYKCQSGRDISYFKKELIKQALSEKLEFERNQKYKASNYFKSHFGILSLYREHHTETWSSIWLKKINLVEPIFIGEVNFNPLSVEHYKYFYEYKLTYEMNSLHSTNRIVLSTDINHGESMNLHFNKDGDYVNRDYNQNLNEYVNEDISQKILFQKFKEMIVNLQGLEKLEYYNGKYYTDKYCIIPFFDKGDFKYEGGINFIGVREDGKSYQSQRGLPIYKKPTQKKLEPRTVQDLLSDTIANFSQAFMYLFGEFEIKGKEEKAHFTIE